VGERNLQRNNRPSDTPSQLRFRKLTDVDSVSPRGPFGDDFVSIPKVNGGIVVKGPNARGDEIAVAHELEGGLGGSITVVADWRMSRVGGGDETTEEERRAGRTAVVRRLAEAPPRSRPGTAHASSFLFPRNPQRTTGSQRATQANNQMVPDGKGGFEKRAKQKGEPVVFFRPSGRRKESLAPFPCRACFFSFLFSRIVGGEMYRFVFVFCAAVAAAIVVVRML